MKKIIILLFVFVFNKAFCNEYTYKIGNDVLIVTVDDSYKYTIDLLLNNYKDLDIDRDLSSDTFNLEIKTTLDKYQQCSYSTTGNGKYYLDPVTMTKIEGGSAGYVRFIYQEFTIPTIVYFEIIGSKNKSEIFRQNISWGIGIPDIIKNDYRYNYIHKMVFYKLFYFFEYNVKIDVTNYNSNITLYNAVKNKYKNASLKKKEKFKNKNIDYKHNKVEYWYI